MIRIVTDSASDIGQKEARALGIDVAPLSVAFGEAVYMDGIGMTAEEFYKRLASADELPRTSQPSPDTFAAIFAPYAEAGDEIICVLVASKLSGTCQSASIAAGMFPDADITVIDSRTASIGERLIVSEAVRLRDAGMAAHEMARTLDALAGKVRIYAMVATLKYLRMGGRLSAAASAAGTLLGVTPVICLANGELAVAGKARGKKGAFVLMAGQLRAFPPKPGAPMVCGYAGERASMDAFMESASISSAECPVVESAIGSVIGTHIGPGACGVAYFEE